MSDCAVSGHSAPPAERHDLVGAPDSESRIVGRSGRSRLFFWM